MNRYTPFIPADYSDAGNSGLFVVTAKDKLIYVKALGWLVWNGEKWDANSLAAQQMAVDFTRQMLEAATQALIEARRELTQAEAEGDAERVKRAKIECATWRKALAHAQKSRQAPRINAMLELSRSKLNKELMQLDSHWWMLNCDSGVINLKTGEVLPYEPKLLCSKQAYATLGNSGAEIWQKFLDDITCGDVELVEFLQQVCGMAAIGRVFSENLIIAYGEGRNGKSTFFNAIASVMGDYAGRVRPEILTTSGQGQARFALAELCGKRLVIAAELEEGTRLSTSILKQLCSTDTIAAERKYCQPESFTPSHTLILQTNHLPKIGSNDSGTWRRIILIPFNAKFEGTADIKNYADYLTQHCSAAILSWIVAGAKQFIENGCVLKKPACVTQVTQSYQAASDWLSQYLEARCQKGMGYLAKSGELYADYRYYANENGEYVRSQRDFSTAILRAGYTSRHSKTGTVWEGIKLTKPAIYQGVVTCGDG